MAEILHLWALAPAAVGTCCMAADRRRARAPELVASAVMLLAMLDLVRARPLLVPVAWAALLLVAAMTLAAMRSVQQRARERRPDAGTGALVGTGMTVHTTIGMVLMAALVMLMGAGSGVAASGAMAGMAGMHAAGGGGLAVLAALAVGVYAVASVVIALRAHPRLDRAQFVAMGASTAVMAVAVLL